MPRHTWLALLLIAVPAAGTPAHGQAAPTVKEERPGLLKRARVSASVALDSARTRVSDGTLKSAEIEREDGKLVYSFAFTRPGRPGEDEVLVDAVKGTVLGVEHESPEAEARETAKDKRPAPRPKRPHAGP